MLILGINGWLERGHDAASCLLRDGHIVAMAEEERFNRHKHAYDCLPLRSIAYCLHVAGVTPDDLDVIAWGWDLPYLHSFCGRTFTHTDRSLNQLLFPRSHYSQRSKVVPVHFVPHHFAHAASVYAYRNNETPVGILVLDGQGEDVSISLFYGSHGKISALASFPITVSPGFFYEAGCQLLGFRRTDGGKLMGLASYGDPEGNLEDFFMTRPSEPIRLARRTPKYTAHGVLDWEDEVVRWWSTQFSNRWGTLVSTQHQYDVRSGRWKTNAKFGPREHNIAATIQATLEAVYEWAIGEAIRLSSSRVIGVAGGVALNCSANGRIIEQRLVDQLIIQPASGDAGTALGAALYLNGTIPPLNFTHPYLGPEYPRENILAHLLESKITFSEPENMTKVIATAIARGKVVGWFQGRMEIGPRALGARSILADPRSPQMSRIVNTIKSRELWRPLAPVMRIEDVDEYLNIPGAYPHMLVRNRVRPEKQQCIPAVIHVDGSVRPQTVAGSSPPLLHALLTDFQTVTGVPILLNTSFNAGHEPIVCSPTDALRTFFTTGIDIIALGPFLIEK